MAEQYEWGDLEAEFTATLHETKIEPVPDAIVKLAQRSLEGVPHPADDTKRLHAMQREFASPEMAAAFAKHMRNAGQHTKPLSSITVVIDPERTKVPALNADGSEQVNAETGRVVKTWGPAVNPRKVAWRAGERRGRAPSA